MSLRAEDIQLYRRQGYLFIPAMFGEGDIETLKQAIPTRQELKDIPHIIDPDGSARIIFGMHTIREPFRRLVLHPKLLLGARQLLNGDVYVHQSKIVAKSFFATDGIPWHQDYVFWKKRDRVPTSRMLSAIVFLDAVSALNAPIFILAGSQRAGMVDGDTYSLDRATIKELALSYPIEVPMGAAGSIIFLDSMVVHGSGVNISPYDRRLSFITYNSVENAPPRFEDEQPPYVSSREREALSLLAESEG